MIVLRAADMVQYNSTRVKRQIYQRRSALQGGTSGIQAPPSIICYRGREERGWGDGDRHARCSTPQCGFGPQSLATLSVHQCPQDPYGLGTPVRTLQNLHVFSIPACSNCTAHCKLTDWMTAWPLHSHPKDSVAESLCRVCGGCANIPDENLTVRR